MKKSQHKKNIFFISTNRSDYGLQKNLIKAVNKNKNYNVKLIISGAHYLNKFGSTLKEFQKDKIKIYKSIKLNLNNDNPYDVSFFNNELSKHINNLFSKNKVDFLFLLGDRSELLNIASIAKIYNIPIGHLHGGESTLGAIDDAIRVSISKLSDLHFVSHVKYKKNLEKIGITKSKIFYVGGLGASSINKIQLLTKKQIESRLNLKIKKKIILVCFHPVTLENQMTKDYCLNLLKSLENFDDLEIIITAPNTDVNHNIIYELTKNFIKKYKHFHFYRSLGTELFYSLLNISTIIIGNSSSGILEAPSFNINIINIGNRQKGRIQSKNVINCRPTINEITKSITKALFNKKYYPKKNRIKNPYFKKNTEENIIKILDNFFQDKYTNKVSKNSYKKKENYIINDQLIKKINEIENPFYKTDIKKKLNKRIALLDL
jgi:GDP/UDP-N,N'-diacetylbacillosamine 2-epimerase (hydrolysing)